MGLSPSEPGNRSPHKPLPGPFMSAKVGTGRRHASPFPALSLRPRQTLSSQAPARAARPHATHRTLSPTAYGPGDTSFGVRATCRRFPLTPMPSFNQLPTLKNAPILARPLHAFQGTNNHPTSLPIFLSPHTGKTTLPSKPGKLASDQNRAEAPITSTPRAPLHPCEPLTPPAPPRYVRPCPFASHAKIGGGIKGRAKKRLPLYSLPSERSERGGGPGWGRITSRHPIAHLQGTRHPSRNRHHHAPS